MKRNHLSFILVVCYVITNSFIGCKKNTAAPKPDCKIVGIISASNVTTFAYNADGRLSSQNDAGGTKRFKYAGNAIIITSTTGTTVKSITTVSLNANGLASNALVTDSAGKFLTNTSYTYNGTELDKSIVTNASGGDPDTTAYTWKGGNMVSIDFGTSILTLNYSGDKKSQTGDVEDIGNLVQGYLTQRSKNLVTSQSINGNASIFNYTFDQDGKISGFNTITNGTALSLNYLYDCN